MKAKPYIKFFEGNWRDEYDDEEDPDNVEAGDVFTAPNYGYGYDRIDILSSVYNRYLDNNVYTCKLHRQDGKIRTEEFFGLQIVDLIQNGTWVRI